MGIVVREHILISKVGLPQLCEDNLLFNDNFVCVIDGATSKSGVLHEGKTSGRIAMEILSKAFEHLKPEFDIEKIVQLFTNTIREYYSRQKLIEHMENNPADRLTASAGVYSKFHNKVWLIGDCQCRVGGTTYTNEKKIDVLLAEVRSLFIQSAFVKGKSVRDLQEKDSGREYILPLLKIQSQYQNSNFANKYSYCVIDGFLPDRSKIKTIDIEAAKTVILASDGYPQLFSSLKETEKRLGYILAEDPLCIDQYKSTKGLGLKNQSFDDRAFIKFDI